MTPNESVTARPTPPRPPQPASAMSPRNLIIAGALVGGLLLLCLLPVMGLSLAWVFSGKAKTPNKADPVVQGEPPEQGKPKPKEAPPPMPPHIRAAVDKGAAHLKKSVLARKDLHPFPGWGTEGLQTGALALTGLAMLEGGIPASDRAVTKALDQVRLNAPRVTHIYSVCAILFFLNRLSEGGALPEDDRKLQRTLALRIVAGQCQDGRWSYVNPPLSEVQEKELMERLETKTYRPTNLNTFTSNSMTQFGLLALWGSRNIIPVRQPILHAAARFHSTQYPSGTWSYGRPDMTHFGQDANTAAGLLALAMEKVLREDMDFQGLRGTTDPPASTGADDQCDKAFAHLGKVIGRPRAESPHTHAETGNIIKADAYGDYYFLWCLERVAVIYDKKTIADKDWYGWGSEVILQNQRGDGSWQDMHGDVCDTCFAVLFLTRANLAKDLTERIRTRGGKAALP